MDLQGQHICKYLNYGSSPPPVGMATKITVKQRAHTFLSISEKLLEVCFCNLVMAKVRSVVVSLVYIGALEGFLKVLSQALKNSRFSNQQANGKGWRGLKPPITLGAIILLCHKH